MSDPHEPSREMKLSEVADVVLAARWSIAAFSLAVVLAVAIVGGVWPRAHIATASVQVSIVAGQEVRMPAIQRDTYAVFHVAEFLNTEMGILRSPAVLEAALERYQTELGEDPGYDAASLARVLHVERRWGSRVLDVSVRDRSPIRAAALANAVTEAYVANNLESRRRTARGAREWLDQQLASSKQRELEDARAIRAMKERHEFEDASHIALRNLEFASLQESRDEIALELAALRAENHILVAFWRDGSDWRSLIGTIRTPLLRELLDDYGRMLTYRARRAARLGPKHPDRVSLEAQVADLEAAIAREMTRALNAQLEQAQGLEQTLAAIDQELDRARQQLLEDVPRFQELDQLRLDHRLATELVDELDARRQQLELASRTQFNNALVLQLATPTDTTRASEPLATLGWAGLISTLFAVGAVLLRDFLSEGQWRKPDALAHALDVPFLGRVPFIAARNEREAAVHTAVAPGSPAAEAIRTVRATLDLRAAEPITRLLVTSAVPADGKTSTVVRLAIANGAAGRRTLIVDADLRRPRQHRIFDVPREPGLSDVVDGDKALTEAIRSTPLTNVDVLPAGSSRARPAELLEAGLPGLLALCAERYDVVLLDSPPASLLADAIGLAAMVDGVVLVTRDRGRPVELLADVVERLRRGNTRVFGLLVNEAEPGWAMAPWRTEGPRPMEDES